MTSITDMLERLSRAKSTTQYKQIMAGFATRYRQDYEKTRALYFLNQITRSNGRTKRR